MTAILMLAALFAQDESEKALAPVAKLAGSWSFKKSGYEKAFACGWEAGKTAFAWRSKTTVGDEVVFADLVVFSYDASKKRIRARQWAHGALSLYDVEVEDEGKKLVMVEVETEGAKDAVWRYRIELKEEGFTYWVDQKAGEAWKPYITHALKKEK
jgi:hypothetical protein